MNDHTLTRRSFLQASAAGLAFATLQQQARATQADELKPDEVVGAFLTELAREQFEDAYKFRTSVAFQRLVSQSEFKQVLEKNRGLVRHISRRIEKSEKQRGVYEYKVHVDGGPGGGADCRLEVSEEQGGWRIRRFTIEKLTQFQIACMTLPYAQFPLERALSGIKSAGYKYVAWGTAHRDADGKSIPIMAPEAPPEKAKELGKKCRDLGLEPLMMFSTIYPENPKGFEVLKQRLLQAGAAGMPQVLTFGHTKGGARQLWIERFKALAPIAKDNNVVLVVKQHGGETGTGSVCAEITREVNHPNIKVNYDAGNVMDYLQEKVDPITDLKKCADEVRSFCIKDHRNFPRGPDKGQDCGPGLGEIDHWKLLHPVAFTGLAMPLCCENIAAPFVPRPKEPEGVDALARRAREFLEVVIHGVQG